MDDTKDTALEGLGDIVSNMMALFILLTMFVLMARVSAATSEAAPTGALGAEPGAFEQNLLDPIPKAQSYVIVTGDGFALLNIDAIITAMASARSVGRTHEINAIYLQAEDAGPEANVPGQVTMTYSDITPFSWTFEVALSEIGAASLGTGEDPDTLLGAIIELVPAGASLTFFVYPDGLTNFLPVEQLLRDGGTCFRWEPWTRTTTEGSTRDNPITLRVGSLRGRRPCPS